MLRGLYCYYRDYVMGQLADWAPLPSAPRPPTVVKTNEDNFDE